MYSHRSSTGPVDLAFTDRYDGVSAVPFDSLNLALVGDDDPAAVERNLALLLEDFAPGAGLADMEQVHGHTVVEAGGPREQCDALVTDRPDVVLMVRVADCVPVLLADPDAGVLGAAHAGRQGLVEGVVEACVARMRDLGADQVEAWVGPHICGACYEVPEALQHEVAALEPASRVDDVVGHARPRHRRRGARPARAGRRRGARRRPAARWSRRTSTPTAATGPAAGRLAGVIRMRP